MGKITTQTDSYFPPSTKCPVPGLLRPKFTQLCVVPDIETIKSNRRRQPLPRRSATVITESQRVGLLPTTTPQASSSTQAAASSSFVYYTPSPIGFSNPTSVLTVQDEGSRHNLSGILSQLPDLTSTQIVEQPHQQQQQPQQQLFTITTSAPPQQQQQPPQ